MQRRRSLLIGAAAGGNSIPRLFRRASTLATIIHPLEGARFMPRLNRWFTTGANCPFLRPGAPLCNGTASVYGSDHEVFGPATPFDVLPDGIARRASSFSGDRSAAMSGWTKAGRVVLGAALGLALGPALAHAQATSPQPASGQRPSASKAASDPSGLAPHRAVYEITLDQSRSTSTVSDMTGRMVYELTGSACEGYTQNMRFVSRMSGQDGTVGITDMRTSSWEDGLAKSFRFNSSQYKDQKLSESTNGDAARSEQSGETKVELTRPEKKQVKLKPDVFFPIQHSIALLAAAKRGETTFQADLYDGSEKGEKVYPTTTYIGKARGPGFNQKLGPRALPM